MNNLGSYIIGLSVLMLEARGRVGGRTYTVESDGKCLLLEPFR